MIFTALRPAIVILGCLTLITGIAYPLAITGIASAVFPRQSDGSLIIENGKAIGSSLIGQNFSAAEDFWGRPSATGASPYNAQASSGSNLGPLNPVLIDAVKSRIAALRAADPGNAKLVPIDLVTASASGLDPHISVAAAKYQLERVARARHMDVQSVQALIDKHTRKPWLGSFGEPRVNVLELNLALRRTAS